METPKRPLTRLAATGGAIALAILAVLTAFLALSSHDVSPAQAQGPEEATPQSQGLPSSLQLPPPLQIATPAPGADVAAVPQADGDLEAVRFRPQVRLTKGQPSVLPQTGAKPSTTLQSDGAKPQGGGQIGPQQGYVSPDYEATLSPMGWGPLMYEGFDTFLPPGLETLFPPEYGTSSWIVHDFSDDGYERTWGANDWQYYYHADDPADVQSAWPAAYGTDALDPNAWYYPNDLASWMEYGPIDFSSLGDAFASFGLWYNTEPEYDWVYFCVSTDFVNYDCDYWSGDSGDWTDQAYWLTSYAGYSQVWLAWVFESDSSIVSDGPLVDEIWVWGEDLSATPTPVPTPDPAGELVVNGSFESGALSPWDTDSGVEYVGVLTETQIEGQYAAYLYREGMGWDELYQTLVVPAGLDDLAVNFWFGMASNELMEGYDWFCASLADPADHDTVVDLGCVDAIDATGEWEEYLYTLSDSELNQVTGLSVDLVFTLFSDVDFYNYGDPGTGGSVVVVDYVRVQATGSGAGASIDANEPNDGPSDATPISCGDTISGTIGDALGGEDVDWFAIAGVPLGQIDVDIDADVKVPPSELDSVVGLWDSAPSLVASNDDDGASYDSYVTYTVSSADTYYVSVESYSGYGSPGSYYELTVLCADAGSGPPPGGNEVAPPVSDSWTVMLYLNAEDPSFESILRRYRTDIEAWIGGKSSFLNVVVLYDGPPGSGDAGTTRYLVQPNGAYTLGTNKWDRGELNMGHPDTLADFVTWAMDRYPADHYYLAIDDHGDGAYGISVDRTSNNDQLTPRELYAALKIATQNGAHKIDIFDYEACLMGLAENAYDLRAWVDYVVFSEQISWGINTYPRYFADLSASDTPLPVGQRIVERYHAGALAANGGRGYPHTISLIDTSQMEAVRGAVSAFGNELRDDPTSDAINAARGRSQAFAADMDATNPARAEYIDLWDLADEAQGLAPAQAAAVKAAVQAAVVYERHAGGTIGGYTWDHSGAHGLAIYYPFSQSSSAFQVYIGPNLYYMSVDGDWDTFLEWAVPGGIGRGMFASRSQDKLSGGDAYAFRYVYLPLNLGGR